MEKKIPVMDSGILIRTPPLRPPLDKMGLCRQCFLLSSAAFLPTVLPAARPADHFARLTLNTVEAITCQIFFITQSVFVVFCQSGLKASLFFFQLMERHDGEAVV